MLEQLDVNQVFLPSHTYLYMRLAEKSLPAGRCFARTSNWSEIGDLERLDPALSDCKGLLLSGRSGNSS